MRVAAVLFMIAGFPVGFAGLLVGSIQAMAGQPINLAVGSVGLLTAVLIVGRWAYKDANAATKN